LNSLPLGRACTRARQAVRARPPMAPSAAPCDVKVTRASLEGDGVGDRLFELLWKRDLFSDSSLEMRIPDTVVFRYGAPLVWYFTSLDGTVKRKTKAKVNSERIFEEFVKRASPSGILASYVSSIRSDDEPEPGPDAIEQDGTAGTKTTIEYLNRDALWHVLFNRQKVRPDGILQKFVEPKGDHNNMIRVLWSPKVCLLERRVNNKRLSDTKYDVYERAVTFEGSEFLSEVTPVRGPTMVMQVHDIADAIVQHIAAVTGDRMKISRMALNFKVDERDRLWLLFASSLRLRGDHASDLLENGMNTPLEANTVLQVPDHVRRIGTTMMSRPAALQCTCRCPTCADKVQGGELCDVSYKVIIEYEERRRGIGQPLPTALWPQWPPTEACPGANRAVEEPEPELRDRFMQVPEPLQLLHPRLTSDEYGRFRHDVVFLYKVASVCEACYLRFSAPQLGSQWKGESEDAEGLASSTQPQGTQALDPNRLRKRQHVTQRRVLDQKVCEDVQFEAQLRCRTEKLQLKRAQSCPKLLPSWGTGHNSKVCSNPPAPVLGDRPWPPQGRAPLWAGVARSSPSYSMEISPQRRRRVPKLLGAPYLKDLQAFAVNCPSRAHSVVPSMPPRSMPVNTGDKGAKNRSSGSRPVPATTSAATALPAVASSASAPEMRATKLRLRPSSADDDWETEGLNALARPLFLDDDSDDGGVLEDAGADDADSLVAKLWEQWPESCGAGGGASSATTTRPPSAADGARTSSYPNSTTANSRNSSRPMSRLMSAQSKSRPSRPQSAAVAPSHAGSSSRPLSSPLLRGSMGRADEQAALHRPASSPQLRHGPPRPSAMHGTSPGRRVPPGEPEDF